MAFQQVVLNAYGEADQLELREIDEMPVPAPGEVRIRVLVTSAAFTDVMIRKGMYQDVKEKPPFVPGYDLVGIIDALGVGVSGFDIGDRVADLTTIGAYSEYACVSANCLTKVPAKVSDEDALAMILSGVTAYQLLHRVARVNAGQRVLIHGAGGAVGTALVQLATRADLKVYGTDVLSKYATIKSLGAVPIDAESSDLDAAISMEVGEGVDFVFDPIGGESLSRSLHALKPSGTLIAFGFTDEVMGRGGSIPYDFVRLKLWDWLPNSHATAFYSIGAMRRKRPEWFREDLAFLFDLLAKGEFKPVVAKILPLAEVREAHRRIEAGAVTGKLVLRVSDR